MAVWISVGVSDEFDALQAFSDAAAEAKRGLGDATCDLCLVFAGAPHLGHGKWILSTVHDTLDPSHLVGCGAAGVVGGGAVGCSLSGVPVAACVSQGAAPVGPEMTVTAATGNVIEELASRPAIERLRSAIAALDAREQALAAGGLMLGLVIDENKP